MSDFTNEIVLYSIKKRITITKKIINLIFYLNKNSKKCDFFFIFKNYFLSYKIYKYNYWKQPSNLKLKILDTFDTLAKVNTIKNK